MTSPPSGGIAIELRELTLGHRGVVAVEALDGQFVRGSMTAIHGPNGAGKSTLLDAIAGFLRPVRGRIDRDPDSRIAYLPQRSRIDRTFPIDVSQVVALGSWPRTGALCRLRASDREAIDETLSLLDIGDLADRPIASLSTGQFQRVLFARAIVQDADIFVLDEPFNAVDLRTTSDLLDLLHRLHVKGRTIVAVLHDIDQIREHFDETLLLARRCLAWGKTAESLNAHNLRAARTFTDSTSSSSSFMRYGT